MVRRNAPSLRRSGSARRRSLLLGPLAAAALVLAACGGDDTSTSSAPPASTAAAVPADPPAADTSGAGSAGAESASRDERIAADSMFVYQPVEYVYEGELPPLDGPAASWRWTPGRVPTTEEIAAVAAAFGLPGEVVEQPADRGGGWVIGGESSPRLWVSEDAQGTWSFSGDDRVLCLDDIDYGVAAESAESAESAEPLAAVSDPAPETPVETAVVEPGAADVEPGPADGTAVDAPVAPPDTVPCVEPVGIPTAEEAQARAIELFAALGLDPANYSFHTDSQEWGAWVDARLIVDGLESPVTTSFGFGAEGSITYASGQLFAPEPGDTYARIGTTAALEQLIADQLATYSPTIDAATVDAPEPRPAAVPVEPVVEGAAPIDGEAATVEPVVVTLTGVTEGWWMTWSPDGTVELVPGYDFVIADGGEISAPAIAPADLPPVDTGVAEPAIDAATGAGEPEPAIEPAIDPAG